MSETRKIYPVFVQQHPSQISFDALETFLFEGTSGLASFYNCPEICEEYSSWLKFLLPDLLLRAREVRVQDTLFELTVTMFIRVFGDESDWTPEFYRATLQTLGMAFMTPSVFSYVHPEQALLPNLGTLAAALAFCLMYFPETAVRDWTMSLLTIEDHEFRARFLLWLAAAYKPLKLGDFNNLATSVNSETLSWGNSHLLAKSSCLNRKCDLNIPTKNVEIFLNTVCQTLSYDKLCSWLQQLGSAENNRFKYIETTQTGEFIADVVLANN